MYAATMTLTTYFTGAGGASLAGVLLSEQPKSKRERAASLADDHAASECARSARTAGCSHSPSEVSPSSPQSLSPSPPSSSAAATTATHSGKRFGRCAAAKRGGGRFGWSGDARLRDSRRSDLQRRPEDGHVHPRQGDHLRERARGASGQVSAAATVAAVAVTAVGLCHPEIRRLGHRRRDRSSAALSAAATATRGQSAADGAARRERVRTEWRRRDPHDDGARAFGARRRRPGRRRCGRATTHAHCRRRCCHSFASCRVSFYNFSSFLLY